MIDGESIAFTITWTTKTVQNSTPDPTLDTYISTIQDVSRDINIFGFQAQDFLRGSISWQSLIHPADKDWVARAITKTLNSETQNYQLSYRISHNFEILWIQESGTIFRNDTGEFLRCQSIFNDISDQKASEAELNQKNLYLNLLHQTSINLSKRQPLNKTLDTILEHLNLLGKTTDSYIAIKNDSINGLSNVSATGIFTDFSFETENNTTGGAYAEVWRTGQAVYEEDYQQYPQQIQKEITNHIASVACLPLNANGEFLGVIGYTTKKRMQFTDKLKLMLQQYAQLVSLVLDNAKLIEGLSEQKQALENSEQKYKHLFTQAQRHSDELSLLYELQRAISGHLDLDELFDVSLQKTIDIFDYDFANMFILEGDTLSLVSTCGFRTPATPQKVSTNERLANQILSSKQSILLTSNNIGDYLEYKDKTHFASMIVVPIVIDNTLFGALDVGKQSQDLDKADLHRIQKVCDLLTVAIENAQLHAKVKLEMHRTNTLHNISAAVQEHNQIEDLLDDIVQQIRSAMDASSARLYKINLNNKEIEYSTLSYKDDIHSPLPTIGDNFEEFYNSMGGWSVRNKNLAFRPKGVTDPREHPKYLEKLDANKIGSLVTIPFVSNQTVQGLISIVNHKDEPDFTKGDLQLLRIIANQVGSAFAKYQLIRQIEFQAYHDSLTKLPNRRQFENEVLSLIDSASRRNLQFAVLFVDLDGFKHVNDSLGHNLGDQLLIATAKRLDHRKRSGDILARMGGDEFAVVLSNVNTKDIALQIANKYLEFIVEPFKIDGHNIKISASIGVSLYPEDGANLQTLLVNADMAMYQAKQAGKGNASSFTKSLADKTKERSNLENELKLGISNGELELHYQPQYNIFSGNLIGLEALVRWQHADKGLISPGVFIPIAEESNLIIDIGNWVLNEACRQTAEWQAQGYDVPQIAVNVSAKQFTKDDFIETVIMALESHNLPARCLEIEVTESVVMDDIESVIERLHQLKNLNVHIAIDDFGTGYSSLTYLQDLPLNKLKIDKSFVDKIDTTDNPAIIKTILTLAKSLGLTTIAEGVESRKQLELLKTLDCDQAQGFYFAKPMPAFQVFENTNVIAFTKTQESSTSKSLIRN